MKNSPIEESKSTIEIFIKLLETSNKAKSLLGLFLNSDINFKALLLDLEAFLMSVLESEKKATSDPEINAELKSNSTINTILINKE